MIRAMPEVDRTNGFFVALFERKSKKELSADGGAGRGQKRDSSAMTHATAPASAGAGAGAGAAPSAVGAAGGAQSAVKRVNAGLSKKKIPITMR